jgi:hypothetical protein
LEITTSSLYCEVGVYFSISYKVDLFIRNKLNEIIVRDFELDKVYEGRYLNLIVSTNSQIKDVEVKGMSTKGRGTINCGIWLPCAIINNEDQLIPYIHYYFEAVFFVLKKYHVTEAALLKVREIVENEVIGNPEYAYFEETIPDPDLSDLNL